MEVTVTFPPNSKDVHCDMYAQTGIKRKLKKNGQCKFLVRSKFPKNVRIRVQARHFISVNRKFYEVKTPWKRMTLVFLKRKPTMVFYSLIIVYHV